MRLFKSSEYAIRCLVYMAVGDDEVYSAKALSNALDMPYKFLARLLSRLASAGLVTAQHGQHGGYTIARPLGEIHLADIIEIVEGLEHYDRCILGFETCDDANPCPLHEEWKGHKDGILHMIHNVTLAELAGGATGRL